MANIYSNLEGYCTNIVCSGNYFQNGILSLYQFGVKSLVIINNFFDNSSLYTDYQAVGGSTIEFSNNTYFGRSLSLCIYNQGSISYTINNNIFANNTAQIYWGGSGTNTPISMNNNVFYTSNIDFISYVSSSSIPIPSSVTQSNNQFNATSSIFVSPTGQSTDGQWQVLQNSTSVAYKAGTDGTDCGMFGGALPYTLSGLPAIPSIATINITGGSTVTSNNFSFSIGAQSNK